MDEKEKKGSVFPKSLNDYKAVVRSEAKRTFSFMPDAPCRNPREFTDELLKFANKEGLNIVITKETFFCPGATCLLRGRALLPLERW